MGETAIRLAKVTSRILISSKTPLEVALDGADILQAPGNMVECKGEWSQGAEELANEVSGSGYWLESTAKSGCATALHRRRLAAAALVQFGELPLRFGVALVGRGREQHARLIAALRDAFAAQIEIGERGLGGEVALLHRGP